MSAESSFDPYRSPSLPEGVPLPPRVGGRPGWLTMLCVLCIVLGAMGLLNTVMSTGGLLMGEQLQKLATAPQTPGTSDKMQEAQEKFQNEMYAVQRKYWWPLMAGLLLRFIVASVLVVGGVRAMGMSEGGRATLLIACGLALPFELGYTILQSLIMLENMTAMHSFAEALASEIPKQGDTQGVGDFVQRVFQGTMIASLVIMYLFALLKIGLYLFGLIYLQRGDIKKLFQSAPPSAMTALPITPVS